MFRDYLMVTKVMFRNSFNKTKGDKKSKWMYLGFFLGMSPLIAFVCFAVAAITPKVIEAGFFTEFSSVIMTMGQFTVFFFGIFSILSYMFFSQDAEFLASLPVKKSALFTAKLTMVYASELILAVYFLLPLLLTMGISALVSGYSISALYFILLPFAVLLMPLIPLLLVSLLAFPMMYVVTFFRKRSVLTTVVIILIFMAFMGAYLGIVNTYATEEDIDFGAILTGEQYLNVFNNISKIAFFNTALSRAMLGTGNAFINLGLYLGTLGISLAGTIAIASMLYENSVAAQLESPKSEKKTAEFSNRNSIAKAVMIRDFKMLVRSPAFAFQSFMGPFIMPIMIFFMGINMAGVSGVDPETNIEFTQLSFTGFAMLMSIMLLCGTNFVASVAFTREGKFFYFNKYLPLPLNEVIKGKMYFAVAFALFGTITSSIAYLIVAKTNVINQLMYIVTIGALSVAFAYMGIYRDLKKPKLNWSNVNEAVKQNINAMIPVFTGMGVGMVVMVAAMVMDNAIKDSKWLAWSIMWIIALIPAVILYFYYKQKLDQDAAELFERIVC